MSTIINGDDAEYVGDAHVAPSDGDLRNATSIQTLAQTMADNLAFLRRTQRNSLAAGWLNSGNYPITIFDGPLNWNPAIPNAIQWYPLLGDNGVYLATDSTDMNVGFSWDGQFWIPVLGSLPTLQLAAELHDFEGRVFATNNEGVMYPEFNDPVNDDWIQVNHLESGSSVVVSVAFNPSTRVYCITRLGVHSDAVLRGTFSGSLPGVPGPAAGPAGSGVNTVGSIANMTHIRFGALLTGDTWVAMSDTDTITGLNTSVWFSLDDGVNWAQSDMANPYPGSGGGRVLEFNPETGEFFALFNDFGIPESRMYKSVDGAAWVEDVAGFGSAFGGGVTYRGVPNSLHYLGNGIMVLLGDPVLSSPDKFAMGGNMISFDNGATWQTLMINDGSTCRDITINGHGASLVIGQHSGLARVWKTGAIEISAVP